MQSPTTAHLSTVGASWELEIQRMRHDSLLMRSAWELEQTDSNEIPSMEYDAEEHVYDSSPSREPSPWELPSTASLPRDAACIAGRYGRPVSMRFAALQPQQRRRGTPANGDANRLDAEQAAALVARLNHSESTAAEMCCHTLGRPTNVKLRVASLALAFSNFAAFWHLLYFAVNTPTLSPTLVVLTSIWGLLITPIAIYTFFLWTKQTTPAPAQNAFGLKVTWQRDWFVEWKYRLILMLLLTNVVFQQALTTFVIQSSGTFITTVVRDAFAGENTFTAALIPTVLVTSLVGIVVDLRNFYFHTLIIKHDGFDETTRRHRPIVGAVLFVAIDAVMLALALAVFVVRVSTGTGVVMALTLISAAYSILYAIQACTAKHLEMEWHIFAQHLPLQHLFVLTTCGAILFDQLLVSNLETTFTQLIVDLAPTHRFVVASALALSIGNVVAMMLAVNLHSGVQILLEEFVFRTMMAKA